ncbi:MAG: NAD(P) transhydrogenase subunit alpha [Vicinamibacteria bacterium]|nr:NAD(P) transhydrogenase subunit alpha [Vicinamibacteria bacterium]
MSLRIGVLKETPSGEKRVAIVPADLKVLKALGAEIVIEADAGAASTYTDSAYEAAGATMAKTREELLATCPVALFVSPETGLKGPGRSDQLFVGMGDALSKPGPHEALAKGGASIIALELLPRITRAQSMDVLSSMATLLGYRGVLLAAEALPRVFPLMMTAAGTLAPARVLIMGVGVAGLSAIATSKRLGASVLAYDVRAAAKEQVASLGAKFLEIEVDSSEAEGTGGYAKAVSEDFLARQRAAMLKAVSESDVVIATAGVPGKKAPILVTRAMVEAMRPGSVVVDLMAEYGGNCEVTKAGATESVGAVSVLGPTHVVSSLGAHASQMFSRNILNFLKLIVKKGELVLDMEDEIVRDVLVARGGAVVQPRVREALGLASVTMASGTLE